MIAASGGGAGVRDEGGLLSALRAPVDSAGGEDAYEYLFEKVAALGYRIIANHPFVDGNKRTALLLMLQTLEWNGHYATWSDETETLVINLVGAGHLKLGGFRHALLFGCGYDVTATDVTARL